MFSVANRLAGTRQFNMHARQLIFVCAHFRCAFFFGTCIVFSPKINNIVPLAHQSSIHRSYSLAAARFIHTPKSFTYFHVPLLISYFYFGLPTSFFLSLHIIIVWRMVAEVATIVSHFYFFSSLSKQTQSIFLILKT